MSHVTSYKHSFLWTFPLFELLHFVSRLLTKKGLKGLINLISSHQQRWTGTKKLGWEFLEQTSPLRSLLRHSCNPLNHAYCLLYVLITAIESSTDSLARTKTDSYGDIIEWKVRFSVEKFKDIFHRPTLGITHWDSAWCTRWPLHPWPPVSLNWKYIIGPIHNNFHRSSHPLLIND